MISSQRGFAFPDGPCPDFWPISDLPPLPLTSCAATAPKPLAVDVQAAGVQGLKDYSSPILVYGCTHYWDTWDTGKDNGNYHLGFRVLGLGFTVPPK